MLPAANTTNVRPRVSSQDKVKYVEQLNQLAGVIHNDHLFDVYLGECVAPYIALDPTKAVLPVHRPTMTMPLNHDECKANKHNACRVEVTALQTTMQRRWNNASEMFRRAHENQAIKDLYLNLNHLNKLTSQLESMQDVMANDEMVRVTYTESGQPTAAIINDHYAIVDRTLYQAICRSRDEAHYVLALINSNALAAATEPFMPRGLYGPRHFEKHGWKLPIPRYDAHDPLHVQLSELGATAEQECREMIAQSDIMTKPVGDTQSRAARRLLRHEWKPNSATAQAIEVAVAELLSDPAQAALAERQMQEA